MFKPTLRNMQAHSATCSCLIELPVLASKISCIIFADFFSILGLFTGLSLYIMNIAGRISEAAMVGAGGSQHPVLPVNELKKTCVRSARQKNQLRYVLINSFGF